MSIFLAGFLNPGIDVIDLARVLEEKFLRIGSLKGGQGEEQFGSVSTLVWGKSDFSVVIGHYKISVRNRSISF